MVPRLARRRSRTNILGNSDPVSCGGYFPVAHGQAPTPARTTQAIVIDFDRIMKFTVQRKTCFTFGVLAASSACNNCSHSLSRPPRAPIPAPTCQLLIQRDGPGVLLLCGPRPITEVWSTFGAST